MNENKQLQQYFDFYTLKDCSFGIIDMKNFSLFWATFSLFFFKVGGLFL